MSANSDLSAGREAATLVRRVAEPRLVDDSVKAAIRRAARRLGWTYGRTRHFWYGTAAVRAGEMDTLRLAAGQAQEAKRDELSELRDRLARLERRLDERDAATAREALDLARETLRGRS